MAKNSKDNQELRQTLAKSINDLGLAEGANANDVINTWSMNARESTGEARVAQLAPVIQNFSRKIAEMEFEDRESAYKGSFKAVLDSMYDKDLLYGSGREYSVPNFLPVETYDRNKFVPTQTTSPWNTVSTIQPDEVRKFSLTIQPEEYLPVVNSGGDLNRFITSLKTTLTASINAFMDNKILEDYVLARAANNNTGNLAFDNNNNATVPTDKTSKYTDSTSRNMKECLNVISWLINKMTSTSTNFFNLGGTNSKAFSAASESDVKILCTNKFLQNLKFGIQLGLFSPHLLEPLFSKFVALPDHKLVLPEQAQINAAPNAAPNAASMGTFTNAINDNTLIIVDPSNSFKFGKQYHNFSSQSYAENQCIQLTVHHLPYFGYLQQGQMFVYTSNNLNTLPANAMQNIG